MKVSKTKIAIKNSLILSLTLFMQETIQIGVINVVKTIKRIEIPSTPNLNFIKLFLSHTHTAGVGRKFTFKFSTIIFITYAQWWGGEKIHI